MNRDEKSATIEEIAAQIEGVRGDLRGRLPRHQRPPGRRAARANCAKPTPASAIVKNRLTKLAADKAGEERLAELLQGPTALTFVRGDTAQAAKAITTFNKEHDVLAFKGGFMDGPRSTRTTSSRSPSCPAREVLDGQLAGVVASPLTGLVRGLGSMIQGLALQLGQIAEKGLVTRRGPGRAEPRSRRAEEPTPQARSQPPRRPPRRPEPRRARRGGSSRGAEAEADDFR